MKISITLQLGAHLLSLLHLLLHAWEIVQPCPPAGDLLLLEQWPEFRARHMEASELPSLRGSVILHCRGSASPASAVDVWMLPPWTVKGYAVTKVASRRLSRSRFLSHGQKLRRISS